MILLAPEVSFVTLHMRWHKGCCSNSIHKNEVTVQCVCLQFCHKIHNLYNFYWLLKSWVASHPIGPIIQSQTIGLRTRLMGINPTNFVFIPKSLVLRSIV